MKYITYTLYVMETLIFVKNNKFLYFMVPGLRHKKNNKTIHFSRNQWRKTELWLLGIVWRTGIQHTLQYFNRVNRNHHYLLLSGNWTFVLFKFTFSGYRIDDGSKVMISMIDLPKQRYVRHVVKTILDHISKGRSYQVNSFEIPFHTHNSSFDWRCIQFILGHVVFEHFRLYGKIYKTSRTLRWYWTAKKQINIKTFLFMALNSFLSSHLRIRDYCFRHRNKKKKSHTHFFVVIALNHTITLPLFMTHHIWVTSTTQ